jgi:hypothetical protein
VVGDFNTTKQAGEGESQTLTGIPSGEHVAVLYQDEAGNWGHLAEVATPPTVAPACADLGPLNVQRNGTLPLALTCADADGDTLTYSIVSAPSHGSLGSINQANGAVTYTPAQDYSGPDSFTYKANDGTNDSNTATVNLVVASAANRVPACDDVAPVFVQHGTARKIALHCTDPDGDALTLSTVTDPAKGKLSAIDQSDQSVTYTPDPNAEGADEFTYRANDAQASSPAATVKLDIGPGSGGGGSFSGGPGPSGRVGDLSILSGKLVLKRGTRVKVKLKCPANATGRCRGTLSLRIVKRNAKVIGRRHFAIRPGRSVTLKVRLRRSARSALARKGRLRVRLKASWRDDAAARLAVTKKVTLTSR